MTFELLVLVCLLSNAPTADQCTEKTATDVLKEERVFTSPMDCFMYGSHKVVPLLEALGDEAYFRVKCARAREA